MKSFSHSLQRNTRKDDICGRLGGDEFLLLCKRHHRRLSIKIISRVQSDFNKHSQKLGIDCPQLLAIVHLFTRQIFHLSKD
ncbi:diguanylate cyclase [Vibrio chagasii]|nr:diguanylate cyclase [Vibrio chagasii]